MHNHVYSFHMTDNSFPWVVCASLVNQSRSPSGGRSRPFVFREQSVKRKAAQNILLHRFSFYTTGDRTPLI